MYLFILKHINPYHPSSSFLLKLLYSVNGNLFLIFLTECEWTDMIGPVIEFNINKLS